MILYTFIFWNIYVKTYVKNIQNGNDYSLISYYKFNNQFKMK